MNKFIKGKQYLCGIGYYDSNNIQKYEVGIYEDNGIFSFSNADYDRYQLGYKKSVGSNAIGVISARKL